MGQSILIVLQFFHILAASTLIGVTLYMEFALMPTILKRPAGEAKAFFEANLKPTSILMGISSGLTFLTGLIRGTFYGNIHSFADLTTPYGLTFCVALAMMLTMMVQGPRIGPHLLKGVWKGNKFTSDAQQIVKAAHRLPLFAVVVLLGCMVLMHFGL